MQHRHGSSSSSSPKPRVSMPVVRRAHPNLGFASQLGGNRMTGPLRLVAGVARSPPSPPRKSTPVNCGLSDSDAATNASEHHHFPALRKQLRQRELNSVQQRCLSSSHRHQALAAIWRGSRTRCHSPRLAAPHLPWQCYDSESLVVHELVITGLQNWDHFQLGQGDLLSLFVFLSVKELRACALSGCCAFQSPNRDPHRCASLHFGGCTSAAEINNGVEVG